MFDAIDIVWEYPNACGLTCDSSGRDAFIALTSMTYDPSRKLLPVGGTVGVTV